MTDSQQIEHLQQVVADLLQEARTQGADAAEAGVSAQTGLSVTVRLGETETIEHNSDNGLGITVYFGQRKGSANTTDLRPEAIRESVAAACRIAKYTSEDPAAGLADPELMARDIPDLDLFHPWDINADQAADIGKRCEDAARGFDARITNSEGATVYTQRSAFVYGNSHGFVGGYPTSRHSVSCAVIAQEGDDMERDYWYDSGRVASELGDPIAIGRKAAERSLARLGARHLGTRECPVLFRAETAPSLLRSLFGAIRGHAVYRKSTFLLDQVGTQLFPDWVKISENPLLPRGPASAPFDNEGVATQYRELISDGVLQGYLLDSYSARKLGLQSTASAGGVRNASISSTGQSFDQLVREMDHGVVVTELMGQGSNMVTGDYSRGAAGFWVENGEIKYPVEEITIAGNLKDMFRQLVAVGNDNDIPGSIDTGSWLIERMMVGGD
ncbi:metalloprotease PmbA [Thiosocius teredinicola]|uniref:metalloprotease PmbA n=1 Tax=Thiosocius teredinicola TaxID=1973002 RepID=UPI000990D49C